MAGFNRDYDRALTQRQKAERDAARDAIREQYDAMGREADEDFDRQIAALRQQQVEAYPDKAKQEQIGAQIGSIESQKKAAKKARDAEQSKEMSKTNDMSQYGKGYDYDTFKQEEAQKAQERQSRMDNITSSLGGYFGKKDKNEQKEEGDEVTDIVPGQYTKDPNDPFGNPNLYNGKDDTNSINLGTFGRIDMTDEQKEQVEKDKKAKEDAEASASQEKTGGTGVDSSRLQHNVDEEGNATFEKKNESPDMTYHPALEAVKSIKRPTTVAEDDDKWDDYRTAFGLGRYLSKRLHADDKDPMGRSARLRRQAEMHDIEAGDHQRSMQQNLQIANRDYRSEAEKNAASQAAAENAQKVHNLGNAGAGAAALERDVKSADYNTMMQRSDQQRAEGVKNLEKMHDDRQVAEEERSGADVYDYTARDMNDYNARSGWLSMGGRQSDKKNKRPAPVEEEQTTPVENRTPEPPETEDESAVDTAAAQDVINEFIGASLNDQFNGHKELDSGGKELFSSMSSKFPSLKPIPSWPTSTREEYYKRLGVDVSLANKDPNKWMKATSAWSNSNDEYGNTKDKKALLGELQVQRSSTGDATETRAEGQGGTFARRNIDEGKLGDVVTQE